MKKIAFLLAGICISFLPSLTAQNYQLSTEIKVVQTNVTGGTDTLYNAWAGGMQAPQFEWMDVNRDGKTDIVTFDRADRTFTPYLNISLPGESKYRYAPQYRYIFDSCGCVGWAHLVDYNCDGALDVVCGTLGSNIQVYKQYPNGTGFQKTIDILESIYSWGPTYLYASRADVPVVGDVDGDGDIDVLTFGNASNFIEWHKNLAMDSLGRCDTLMMAVSTYCWGHFHENNSDNGAVIHDTVACPLNGFHPNFKGSPEPEGDRHEGSTILMLDLNDNHLPDLVIGDISFPDLYAVYNDAGTVNHAYIDSVQRHFPSYHNEPMDVKFFPSSAYGDVNNDGIKDLVCAPNLLSDLGPYGKAENYHAVSVHHNQGANNFPDFHYVGRGFLQDENIDNGSHLAPTFMDYNKDGKLDILAGNMGYYNPIDSVYYATIDILENIGTTDVPVFKVIKDYTNWITTNPYPYLKKIAPAVADLDKDGDEDLVVGNSLGTLYYFDNDALPNQPAHFALKTNNLSNIKVDENSAPAFYDIDNDGDKDLFVGSGKGWFTFCRNVSVGTNIQFDTVTTKWGFLKIRDFNLSMNSSGNAKPLIVDYDNDGKMELLVGNVTGKIAIYEDLPANATDTLHFAGFLTNYDFGSYVAPAAAVIDSTHKLSYLVGNERGGMQLYKIPKTNITGVISAQNTPHFFQLYPNPTKDIVKLEVENPAAALYHVSILNPLGQVLNQQYSIENQLTINVANLPSGLYFVRVQLAGKEEVRRLTVIR